MYLSGYKLWAQFPFCQRLPCRSKDTGGSKRTMGKAWRVLEWIVTGGQSVRRRETAEECQRWQRDLNRKLEECNTKQKRFKTQVEALGRCKKRLHKNLKKAAKLIGQASRTDLAAFHKLAPADLLTRAQSISGIHIHYVTQSNVTPPPVASFPVEAAIKVSVKKFDIAVSTAAGTATGVGRGAGVMGARLDFWHCIYGRGDCWSRRDRGTQRGARVVWRRRFSGWRGRDVGWGAGFGRDCRSSYTASDNRVWL